ncbi:MAG: hypothetical protein PHV05_09360 [Candidatus Riflebacteria bacterium]|nr:hypothetical protein [Candidatus Riflebacteria bacterium]
MPQKARHKAKLLLLITLLTAVFCLPAFSITPQAREYLRKARVYFAAGNLNMARDYMQRAAAISPSDNEIKSFKEELQRSIEERVLTLRKQADFFLNSKNIPEATRILGEVLAISSDDGYAKDRLKEIAQINKQIEQYKNQGVVIQNSTGHAHNPDMYSAVSYMSRANGFMAQGDRLNAMLMVENVLKREPTYKPALELKERILNINKLQEVVEKAKTAFLEGRMRETVQGLDVLISQNPEIYEYYLLRAKASLSLQNFSDAEKDLRQYFRHKPDHDVIFPLLSDAFYGQKNYRLAGAFARNPQTGIYYKSFYYRLKCHALAFPIHSVALAIIIGLIPFALYYTWTLSEDLLQRLSTGSLWLALRCVITISLHSPIECLGNLVVVARELNVPWINYLTGITLFKIGQIEGAQRFLTYSFSNAALRMRAYYFFGLTRKLLKHRMCEIDFEESVLSGLGKSSRGWHPNFIKQIERELLISYSKERSDETFEGMAFKLVEDQVGA